MPIAYCTHRDNINKPSASPFKLEGACWNMEQIISISIFQHMINPTKSAPCIILSWTYLISCKYGTDSILKYIYLIILLYDVLYNQGFWFRHWTSIQGACHSSKGHKSLFFVISKMPIAKSKCKSVLSVWQHSDDGSTITILLQDKKLNGFNYRLY